MPESAISGRKSGFSIEKTREFDVKGSGIRSGSVERRCDPSARAIDNTVPSCRLFTAVSLRRLRQRKLRAMLWMRVPAASHFEMSAWAAGSNGGGSANSTSARSATHRSISSRIAPPGCDAVVA